MEQLLESVHLVAIVALAAASVLVALHVTDPRTRVPTSLAVRMIRFGWIGFAIVAASGALLYSQQAGDVAAELAFRFKLQLLVFLALNALVFQLRGSLARRDWLARLQAFGSIAGWAGMVAAGRLVAMHA